MRNQSALPDHGGAPLSQAAPKPARRKFNHSIHGARGLFCLLVFFYHVHNSGLPTFGVMQQGLAYEALDVCKYGVELFFGISGIVIIGTLTRATSTWDFVVNRFTRILPALWLSILAMTAISLAARLPMPGPLEYALNFLSPPPFIEITLMNKAAWSLQYELTFYLIAAAAWKVSRSDPRLGWVIVTAGIGLLLFYPRGLLLLGGVAIALGFGKDRLSGFLGKAPGLMLVLYLIFWRLIELRFGGARGVHSDHDFDMAAITLRYLPPLEWLMAFALILGAGWVGTVALSGINQEAGWLSAILRTPPLQWLGLVSYSFYIWHPVVMGVVKAGIYKLHLDAIAGSSSQLLFFCLALPPALVVAWLSQRWIEVKLTAKLRAWLERTPQREHAPNIPG